MCLIRVYLNRIEWELSTNDGNYNYWSATATPYCCKVYKVSKARLTRLNMMYVIDAIDWY